MSEQFHKDLEDALKSSKANTANKTRFLDEAKAFLLSTESNFESKDSHNMKQLRLAMIELAKAYTDNMQHLDKAFTVLRDESHGYIQGQVGELKKSVKNNTIDIQIARAMNTKSGIDRITNDPDFKIGVFLSHKERENLEKGEFSISSGESWKNAAKLLPSEFANSVKDIFFMVSSIPSSLIAIPRYASLRNERNNSLEHEAKLQALISEFPALGLLDLATDWTKMVDLFTKITTVKTNGDMAFIIISILGLMGGGAALAAKVGSSGARLATKVAYKATGSRDLARVGIRTQRGFISVGNAADTVGAVGGVIDGSALVGKGLGAAAKGGAKLVDAAKGSHLEVPKGLKDTGMTPEKYSEMVATNAKLSPEVRATETAKTIGLENLSDTQKIALEKAHNTGTSGAGEWTQTELKAKIETLREGGFDKTQTRIILEHGYAGGGAIQKLGSGIADAVRTVWKKARERFGKNKKVDISESAHGAPLEPRGDNVRIVTSEKLPVPKQEIIRNFVGNMKKGEVKPLTDIGLPGWHVEKMPQGSAKANNVYELSIPGKNPIHIEGKGNLEKTIQEEVRGINESVASKKAIPEANRSEIKDILSKAGEYPIGTRIEVNVGESTMHTGGKIGLEYVGNGKVKVLEVPTGERAVGKMDYSVKKGEVYDIASRTSSGADVPTLRLTQGSVDHTIVLLDGSGMKVTTPTTKPSRAIEYNNGPKAAVKPHDNISSKPSTQVMSEVAKTDMIQGLKNEIQAAETGKINITPEALAFKKNQLAQLEGGSGSVKTPSDMRARLESIPKGTGETGIKIGDIEYTINRHPSDKIDVTSPKSGVKTYNSIDDFLKDIGGDTGKRNSSEKSQVNNHLKYRISKEVSADIADAMKNGDNSLVYKRIKSGDSTTYLEYDNAIQDAVTRAKSCKTLDEVRRAREVNDTGPRKQNTEVLDTIEREALRRREIELIGQKDPALAAIVDNPAKVAEAVKDNKNWKKWLALGLIVPMLWCIYEYVKDKNPERRINPPSPGDGTTPDGVAAYCKKCANGPESIIDNKRKNEYGQILTEKYREDITKRWMTGREWKAFESAFNRNQKALSALSAPNQKSVVDAINKVLEPNGATVENIQQLQKCIGMFTVISSSGPVRSVVTTLDHKGAQDGILGPITTENLMKFISICTR